MFHEPIRSYLSTSIIKNALDKKIISAHIISILEEVGFNHHKVDDSPYGGGPGELMRIDVIEPLIKKALSITNNDRACKRVVLLDPAGKVFDQAMAKKLSEYNELIFVCGRYEGIDARVHYFVDEAISLGDFVISNGDLAALTVFDATVRLLPNVLGNRQSYEDESFQGHRLECSNYTRPEKYLGYCVPEVLKNGDHKAILEFKALESLIKTLRFRPDLLSKLPLQKHEENLMLNKSKKIIYPWQTYE